MKFFSVLVFPIFALTLLPSAHAARGFIGYGNYCGASNNGGAPTNDLDAICRNHDHCLLNVGLPASPLAKLRSSPEAARASCPCDRVFSEELRNYKGGEGPYANVVWWIASIYAADREGISCRPQRAANVSRLQ